VVLLIGEGGIGKSRLIQVMKDHIGRENHTLFECRSSPYYQNTALYPLVDLGERICGFTRSDTPEEKLAKLEQTLLPYHCVDRETLSLLASLFSIPLSEDRYPSVNLSPQIRRKKTLEALLAIVLENAGQNPVLFILEDLHWTDPSTLELLDLLIDRTPTEALFVILTCRPTFQPPWDIRSHLMSIALNRLSDAQTRAMIDRLISGTCLPTEVVHQIVVKADGVPLYIEEMTKAIVESGVLEIIDDRCQLTGPMPSLAIPSTLQDSLMARLDRLVTAKGIAQLCAAIGRQFSYEILQVLTALDELVLQRELSRLVDAELFYQRGEPPHATYLFKHALIQDAAYQSLLKSTRQEYHQRIAQALLTRLNR
jgi:predicted ATPase